MTAPIFHRGPDSDGVFFDAESGIGLGTRRLSIIDLSAAGAQPMQSADGRWAISFNGEIYNFEEIRNRLADTHSLELWHGRSDTEVLVEAIAAFGCEATLKLTNGMFALAAWDGRNRALYLARDRMGEKPLYYGWQNGTFLFASELKALVAHPKFQRRINHSAVHHYMAFGYVPHPQSIYDGISQLEPGSFIKLAWRDPAGSAPAVHPYWTLPKPSPSAINENEAIERLDELLRDSTKLRMQADVPIGAFLSGGVDSSTITALMQIQSRRRVDTFSIGFHETSYNESHFAREVAQHLATNHTELYVSADDACEVIPHLPQIYDEPLADASQVPTYLLSKLARRDVTVALSGDGGDELFGGYAHYFDFERRWKSRSYIWPPLRQLMVRGLSAISPAVLRTLTRITPQSARANLYPQRFKRIVAGLGARTQQEFYQFLIEKWPSNTSGDASTVDRTIFFNRVEIQDLCDPFSAMMYLDAGSYLPDDILAKVDRASMRASLEVRTPFLDHRIVEFGATLPLALKRRGSDGKWILRQLLNRYVPASLVNRPKQGFGIPVREWLRGPLRDWGEDLIGDRSAFVSVCLDADALRTAWNEHQLGEVDHSDRLWAALMLISWARVWRPVVS